MEIDAFTFVAQIVNFLVLVLLLQRFLYKPLTRAMERRQEEIDRRLEEGRSLKVEAREEAAELERRREELEETREERLREAEHQARQRRQELLDEARREMEDRRRHWTEELRHEREAFLEDLRQRVSRQVVAVSRQALTDLADADLEHRAVRRFVEGLETLADEDRQILTEAARPPGGAESVDAVVTSTFELPEDIRGRIRSRLEDLLPPETPIEFEPSREPGFGVELTVGGVELGWSLDRYLTDLQERMDEILSRQIGTASGVDSGGAR